MAFAFWRFSLDFLHFFFLLVKNLSLLVETRASEYQTPKKTEKKKTKKTKSSRRLTTTKGNTNTKNGRFWVPRARVLRAHFASILDPVCPSLARPPLLAPRRFTTEPEIKSHGQTRERGRAGGAVRNWVDRRANVRAYHGGEFA